MVGVENGPVLTKLALLVESSGHVVVLPLRDVFDSKGESDDEYGAWEGGW